jgi:transcriptional regulator with XRE-family HTH domain
MTTTHQHDKRAPTNADHIVGMRIRARRLELKMSQTDLADCLGLTFQQVQKYEKGINRIGTGRLIEIAAALKVQPTFFLPKSSGGGAALPVSAEETATFDALATKHGMRIAKALPKITPELQSALADLAQAMAGTEHYSSCDTTFATYSTRRPSIGRDCASRLRPLCSSAAPRPRSQSLSGSSTSTVCAASVISQPKARLRAKHTGSDMTLWRLTVRNTVDCIYEVESDEQPSLDDIKDIVPIHWGIQERAIIASACIEDRNAVEVWYVTVRAWMRATFEVLAATREAAIKAASFQVGLPMFVTCEEITAESVKRLAAPRLAKVEDAA